MGLKKEIENAINRASRENESGTPDFILAAFLIRCLIEYETAVESRDNWEAGGKVIIHNDENKKGD